MERGRSDHLLLATKLALPSAYGKRIVERQRLYHQLEAGVRGPVTLVTAPAGFGKTTLVSAWLRQREGNAAWISLEQGDSDLMRFWQYIVNALMEFYRDSDEQRELWQREASSLSVEMMLTALINILAASPEELILVLDNYHTITATAIHHSLNFFIDHLPHHIHIILLTREQPPLPVVQLYVQGKLTELQGRDLCFTFDETKSFLTETMGLALPGEESVELSRRTEGWIAGLQLAALSLRGREDIYSRRRWIEMFRGTDPYIFRYLCDEVLAKQPVELQEFLRATAILDQMNAELCNAVTGRDNADEMLERLKQAHLFLIELDEQGYWYRYMRLFADVLSERLRHEPTEVVRQWQSRANKWYEQQGMVAEMSRHEVSQGDQNRARPEPQGHPIQEQGKDYQQEDSLITAPTLAECTPSISKASEARVVVPTYIRKVLTPDSEIQPFRGNTSVSECNVNIRDTLSEREHAVLVLIAEGLSNQEIAQRLFVTVSTVKTHLNNIYAKLQVHTRLKAVTRAYELGWLRRSERKADLLQSAVHF